LTLFMSMKPLRGLQLSGKNLSVALLSKKPLPAPADEKILGVHPISVRSCPRSEGLPPGFDASSIVPGLIRPLVLWPHSL
jgi:hypothetical protein